MRVARGLQPKASLMRGGYLLAVLVGAYFFTWASTGLGGVLLHRLGLARSEAVLICTLAGFLLFLAATLWALPSRRPLGALTLLFGSGAAMLWTTDMLAVS